MSDHAPIPFDEALKRLAKPRPKKAPPKPKDEPEKPAKSEKKD